MCDIQVKKGGGRERGYRKLYIFTHTLSFPIYAKHIFISLIRNYNKNLFFSTLIHIFNFTHHF